MELGCGGNKIMYMPIYPYTSVFYSVYQAADGLAEDTNKLSKCLMDILVQLTCDYGIILIGFSLKH